MTTDYRSTVFLPQTDLPMKANLPNREPQWLARWAEIGIYDRLRERSAGHDKFVLHDGPPYANGHLHMGHALNKILKDVVNRSKQMQGYDAPYVPGWDCHGLPIEWQIEQTYRKKGKNKDEVPINAFRAECRAHAAKWIEVQREEFKRLGVEGDWAQPYITMDYATEAGTFAELLKFVENGALYRGKRATLWSPVEKTALADAEVEYHDVTSTTIYVRFPVLEAGHAALAGASVVIWTTTPWTMPSNRAIAYGEAIAYRVIVVREVTEDSRAKPGERLVLAAELLDATCAAAGITAHEVAAELPGSALAGTVCAHPLRAAVSVAEGERAAINAGSLPPGQRLQHDVPLLPAGFVTTEQGTGFVHIAPSHGADDYLLGMQHGLEVPDSVNEDGTYAAWMPLFAGTHVYKAAEPVNAALAAAGGLLALGSLYHSYPHSWRSKAPLIFRATTQWFIGLGGAAAIRTKALDAIDATHFVPASGQARLRSMIEQRPDWCVSRQRSWGVPIALFLHKRTGEVLRDEAVNARILRAFEREGADAWFEEGAPARFLGNDYNPDDYQPVSDILEVWFDSGSTHATVLAPRAALRWPADLYLEGSDQHRGWFHTSLLEACGTRGAAPYKAVLTHGFTLDAAGRKMSKSEGNSVAPQDVMKTFGADILRLWVVSQNYTEDQRIGEEILKGQADAYRRLRNTFRFLLGNLHGFTEAERIDVARMPELERLILHRLAEMAELVETCNRTYDYNRLYIALHNFCATELSAFYFDIRKDALYCDSADSVRRRACRTVLDHLFHCLVRWLAPVLVFTCEEVWLTRFPSADDSVHFQTFPAVPETWRDGALAAKWQRVRRVRRVVTGALEVERKNKRIGSSLQAAPVVYVTQDDAEALAGLDLAELAITSGAELRVAAAPATSYRLDEVPGVGVVFAEAAGEKCARCWQVLPEVGEDAAHPELCRRCSAVVRALPVAA